MSSPVHGVEEEQIWVTARLQYTPEKFDRMPTDVTVVNNSGRWSPRLIKGEVGKGILRMDLPKRRSRYRTFTTIFFPLS